MENIQENAKSAAALLKLLSNEVRLLIFCHLGDQKMTVGELNALIDISQSALSQHLAKLREQELVVTEKDGLNVYYSIANPVVLKIISVLQDEFCPPEH